MLYDGDRVVRYLCPQPRPSSCSQRVPNSLSLAVSSRRVPDGLRVATHPVLAAIIRGIGVALNIKREARIKFAKLKLELNLAA